MLFANCWCNTSLVVKLNLIKMNIPSITHIKVAQRSQFTFVQYDVAVSVNLKLYLFWKGRKIRKKISIRCCFSQWQLSAKLLSLFYTKLKYLKAESFMFRERIDSSFFGKLTESYLYVKVSKCFLPGKNINISGWEYSGILSTILRRDVLSTLVYICWAIYYFELQNRRKEEKSLDNPMGSSNPNATAKFSLLDFKID